MKADKSNTLVFNEFEILKKVRKTWKKNPATYIKESEKKVPKGIKHKKKFWDDMYEGE